MTPVDKTPLPWLVDEVCHRKALIRYEIKICETQFNYLLTEKAGNPKTCQMIECCRQLINCYEDLRIITDSRRAFSQTGYIIKQDRLACHQHIQTLQQQLYWRRSGFCEINILDEIVFYYRNLLSLLLEEEPQTLSEQPNEPDMNLLAILQTATAEKWFESIVTFACELGENFAVHRAQLNRLSDEHCLRLYQQFTHVDHLAFLQSLFLLKNQYSQSNDASPQEMIELSRQSKLTLLYLFIQMMHKTVVQMLSQRGFNPIYDCLFHQSANLSPGKQHERFFIRLMDEWQLVRLTFPETTLFRQKLTDLLGAYKYWFNPDMLIDTVMNLKQMFSHEAEGYGFQQHMKSLYQQLTSSECFDLYGYFSNNDTRYLMRTFYAAQQGLTIRGLEGLNAQEKESVADVYHSLECVMEGLLAELQSRHFNVQPYINNREKAIKPRHRILRAIRRVILIYKVVSRTESPVIGHLFDRLEA